MQQGKEHKCQKDSLGAIRRKKAKEGSKHGQKIIATYLQKLNLTNIF